jgi:phage terminase large subunit GpA-like protein
VYDQLTAERLVTRYHKGRPKLEWLKPAGRRNEALDCCVYSRAAEYYLGVPKYADHHWARIEGRLRQRDMLDATPKYTPLPLDKDGATIDAVALEIHPDSNTPQPAATTADQTQALTAQPTPREPPKPPRARNYPRRSGWVKRW